MRALNPPLDRGLVEVRRTDIDVYREESVVRLFF
jgi:hypothetical protein